MPIPNSAKEQAARAMLLLHSKDAIAALETSQAVSAALDEVFENDPYASAEDLDAAAESAIQDLGYATDLASIRSQSDYLRETHAGMWSGNYTIVDSNKEVHCLLINSEKVRLLLDCTDEVLSVPSEGGGFGERKLVVDNDKVKLAFSFSTPLDGVDLTDDKTDLADLARRFQVRLSGTLTVKGDAVGERQIHGKRGVATPAGVLAELGEEPTWVWAGEYRVRYTDTDLWEWLDDPLNISCDSESGALELRLGTERATRIEYRNGVITCRLGADGATRVTMQMCALSGGAREFFAWFETAGQMRTLTGYASRDLDEAQLWRAPVSADDAVQFESTSAPAVVRLTSATVDFCATPYDSIFDAATLVKGASVPANEKKTPEQLFSGATIGGVSGYRVEEVDKDGNATGRFAVFSYTAPSPEKHFFPVGVKLKPYQQLDEAGEPQSGLEHTVVGVLSDQSYELPSLVETDFYEVRMSLRNYAQVDSAGVRIDLAIDDPHQPKLVRASQPSSATCSFDANAGTGPDTSTMTAIGDYTKASVLVRGATGETQVVGFHDYYFSVLPKTAAKVLSVTKTIFNSDNTPVGQPTNAPVPILMHVPIEMDSRDAIEISGDSWPPATRGKLYRATVVAGKGQQPFTWRILRGEKPAGLTWSENASEGNDVSQAGLVSFGLSGTVGDGVSPGTMYQPLIRVMSDKKCVMKPALASPEIVIAEPETQGKTTYEVFNVLSTVIGSVAAIAALVMSYALYRKDVSREKRKAARDTSVKLNELSLDDLKEYGESLEKVAREARKLHKNKGYIRRFKTAIDTYNNEIPGMRQELEVLKEELERAKRESKRQAKEREVKRKKNEIERGERERGREKQKSDINEEHAESSHGE